MWRIWDLHIRVETHQLNKLPFYVFLRNNLNKLTHTPTCPLVSSSLFFAPCQALCSPSFCSGEKMGLGLLLWHHFLNLETQGRKIANLTRGEKAAHQASCCHTCLWTDALKSHEFSCFCHKEGENDLCCELESTNLGMCHFINAPLSHCRPLSSWRPLR